ncbi:phage holin family protein [Paenibacillus eucommiae]|uniref:Toxin secretion/phage lysis holin n=1 Tax=Paenibacillus eucommiae TaxID=1355755 RepID=A0ABS4IUZ4_9BACL|nr:phage holin family protein [Paenibacillus eucommiae]MBP1991407.1 toxin secretion/phage lysis holin [Paenibacillus eucommiae]
MLKFVVEALGIYTSQHTLVSGTIAILGTIMTNLYGGWSASLEALMWLIVGDYTSGIFASLREKKGLSSAIGFRGLAKKAFILFVILIAHKLDVAMNSEVIMLGAIYFYIANELISVTENMGRIGIPVPGSIINVIAVLKKKEEKENQEQNQKKEKE